MPKRKSDMEDVTASLSVSRLKSNIRQARRLLAQEDVKLELRQTTERRVEALEMQLETAQTQKTELKMANAYRGVRFIERKKILRKLNQAKKDVERVSDESERRRLARAIKAFRIDLHYITSYPKTRKYIALFPDGGYIDHRAKPRDDPTERERAAMRKDIGKRMRHAEITAEPELHLDELRETVHPPRAQQPRRPNMPKTSKPASKIKTIDEDDFFEA